MCPFYYVFAEEPENGSEANMERKKLESSDQEQ